MPEPRRSRGFTLVELMIVLVIVTILASIAIPRFARASYGAKEAEADPILKQVYTLQERLHQRTDRYASHFSELEGAAEPVDAARYYQFRITGDGSTWWACATPKTVAGLRSVRIDQNGTFSPITAAECTGNAD